MKVYVLLFKLFKRDPEYHVSYQEFDTILLYESYHDAEFDLEYLISQHSNKDGEYYDHEIFSVVVSKSCNF